MPQQLTEYELQFANKLSCNHTLAKPMPISPAAPIFCENRIFEGEISA